MFWGGFRLLVWNLKAHNFLSQCYFRVNFWSRCCANACGRTAWSAVRLSAAWPCLPWEMLRAFSCSTICLTTLGPRPTASELGGVLDPVRAKRAATVTKDRSPVEVPPLPGSKEVCVLLGCVLIAVLSRPYCPFLRFGGPSTKPLTVGSLCTSSPSVVARTNALPSPCAQARSEPEQKQCADGRVEPWKVARVHRPG